MPNKTNTSTPANKVFAPVALSHETVLNFKQIIGDQIFIAQETPEDLQNVLMNILQLAVSTETAGSIYTPLEIGRMVSTVQYAMNMQRAILLIAEQIEKKNPDYFNL